MVSKFMRRAGAAVAFLCAAALPAAAQQPESRLGWMSELAASCWQGRDASGAVADQQCFQLQFGQFLRAAITRDGFSGDTVFGYSRDRRRLEMYAWTSRGEPSIYTPTYRDGRYVFEGAPENGVATRVVWSRTPDGFEVAEQTRQGDTWQNGEVVTYRRAGAAPRAFTAGVSTHVAGRGFGWLDRLANRCYHQTEPSRNASNRGCFAFQHAGVLRQTWYVGAQVTGEAVMFARPHNQGIQFFHWDASGNFGVGSSTWDGRYLISVTDTADDMRRVLRRSSAGFMITTERRNDDPSLPWEYAHHYRYAR
jgi:hypothetical protein